jgi:general secretion pathway protein D
MVDRSEDLAWRVTEGVVMITTKIKAGGNNILSPYDVRDLVFERTSFIPPQIHEIPTGSLETSEEPRTGGESEDKVAVVEPDLLVQNIKEFTGVDYWEEEGGGTIEATDTGYLIINANSEMHQEVTSLLNDVRRFNTSVVSIDSKFLNVTRAFLQEVGVDWRGLGGDNKGTVALLDDVTNGLDDNASRGGDNSGTGDPAANPVSGAFFNDGADGDVRARTENYFSSDLGRFLGTDGGLTAGITLLDDLQLQAIFTAIEKRSNVEVVNSQMLTVLNNERGHVAIINQTAYVRDFDVEVAQASFIADPIVDVIQDGVVLDVRPVISYDRKYVTMHLEPTVADLQRPIPTFTTSLGGSTLPVTFQLPTLTVTTFATNAKVPDGGSVLLGGLRQVFSRERTATVPILGSIPLLSFFFKQEGISDESFSLMVLVRAHITDVYDLAMGK